MADKLYARLRENVNLKLRRGAWYRVLKQDGMHTILEVNKRPRSVATALLDIVKRPPPRWTVVTERLSGAKPPEAMVEPYGVCPSCSERARVPEKARRFKCPYCKWEFEVAWDEVYPS